MYDGCVVHGHGVSVLLFVLIPTFGFFHTTGTFYFVRYLWTGGMSCKRLREKKKERRLRNLIQKMDNGIAAHVIIGTGTRNGYSLIGFWAKGWMTEWEDG